MDFTLNEQQRMLQETVRRFAETELTEIARQVEARDEPPDRDVMRRYAEMGLLGVNLPAQYGGGGLSHLDAVLVLEELARISIAVAFPVFESCFGPVLAIANFAPGELCERVLPRVCAGEMIISVAMSEPNAGSALTDLTTRARIEGDTVIVNGQKRWCSGAGGAVMIEKERNGFSFGKRERHMGFRGVTSADMYFDNVEVPASNVVAPAGGFKKLMEAFDLERCGNTTMSLACAQSAYDYALDYVQQRKQFGKLLIEFQAVQIQIAEMKMKLDAARLLLYRAVVNGQNGLPSAGESSIAKCFANEMTREVTGVAMQLMGGYGYSREFPIEQKMRDAWGWGIAGGAIDIQKVNIAAAVAGRRFSQR